MSVARLSRASVLALALVCLPQAVAAQIFTPTYQSPRTQSSLGAYLSDGPGEFAAEAILRGSMGGYELGVRGGIVDSDDTRLLLGVEYRNPIALIAAPIDVAVTAGAQGVFGDADVWGAQAGLSLGVTVVPGTFSLTPYVHPRVAFIDYGGDSDLETELLAEIGADIGFAQGLTFRFAAAFDDVGADWGVGLSWAR